MITTEIEIAQDFPVTELKGRQTPGDSRAQAMLQSILSSAPRDISDSGIEMEILLMPGQTILHYRDADGLERFKLVAMSALKAAFSSQPTDSGWLPSGIVRWGESVRGKYIVQWIPPSKHKITIEVSAPADEDAAEGGIKTVMEDYEVPLPGLVFFGIGREWYLWALQGDDFMPNHVTYSPPLPNVYSGGKICWGANKPPVAGASTLVQAWELFIHSPFNNHLAGNHSVSFPNDVRAQLATLATKKISQYPTTDLVKDGWNTLMGRIAELVGSKEGVI